MKHNLEFIFRLCIAVYLYMAAPCFLQAREPAPAYGIRIQSVPFDHSEYTSILLDNGEPIATRDRDIRIDMDIWAYPENALGSVCKIVADNGSSIDLLYTVGEKYQRFPMLLTGERDIVQSKPIQFAEWEHASISMSPKTGVVTLDYNGVISETVYPAFIGAKSIRVAAGLCKLTDLLLFDVATVSIKDLKITRGGKEIRFWKMERHDGNVCYDEIEHAPATVENANWLLDENSSWKKIYTATFPFFPSVAFDPRVATFYMAYKDDRSLYVFHANEEATDTIYVKGGEFLADYPNQLIYLPEKQQLLSYNLDENTFSFFDPSSQRWSNERKSTKEHSFWNNTTVFEPADSALISFGGYGFYHYNNTLLRSYPYSRKPQKAVILDDIHPRYSCSSALVDSTLYLFGGRGCKSGRQELNPRNYYDMYAVDLRTDKVTKLWGGNESPLGKSREFIPGENMIYDKESGCMYIFTTYAGGTLFRTNMKTGYFEAVSMPAGASLSAQTLYCNLYYSPAQKSFYAVAVNSDVQGVSTLNIYQLDYPPVTIASLSQNMTEGQAGRKSAILLISLIVGCMLIAAAIALLIVRRSHKIHSDKHLEIFEEPQTQQPQTAPVVSSKPEGQPSIDQTDTPATPVAEPAKPFYDLEHSSVRFLGGFRVFDKDGQDITNIFTPTLKKLLILLILYTGKNPMGIPNSKLLSTLWGDKEEDAAKNNRNVYMSRLRNVLSQIGDVTIQSHNGFRNINFGEGTTCDYLEALKLFDSKDSESLDRLLELLFNGMILPNVEIDYVDTFKSNFSNRTLDLLSDLISKPDLSSALKLKIAETLFQHDYINEDALFVKCRLLHSQGRTGLAQTTYASFCKEYRSAIGSEYPHSLTDILNNNISDT